MFVDTVTQDSNSTPLRSCLPAQIVLSLGQPGIIISSTCHRSANSVACSCKACTWCPQCLLQTALGMTFSPLSLTAHFSICCQHRSAFDVTLTHTREMHHVMQAQRTVDVYTQTHTMHTNTRHLCVMISCCGTCRHAMPCNDMPCNDMPCHVTACHAVKPNHAMPCDAM